MRLHMVNLPHTATVRGTSWCAYTEKVRKGATMMTERGHKVFLYAAGPEHNDAECEECIAIQDAPENPGVVVHPEWTLEYFARANGRAIAEIAERIEKHDLLLLIGGGCQAPIAEAFTEHLNCEWGIGYEGTFSKYRVFESYAWMHIVYGAQQGAMGANGKFYDTVIPNFFEVEQFPAGDGKGDYLLFVGRLIDRKGIQVVLDVAKRTGLPLKVAGQPDEPEVFANLMSQPNVEYMGVVGPEERAELMGGARCLLCPTLYVEPFGGVNVEAQMCGTPVITTDWGAFTETVEEGLTGFRPHDLEGFCEATDAARDLDRRAIRERAIALYSTEVVSGMYEDYFERLATLWGDGWYATRDEREELTALVG